MLTTVISSVFFRLPPAFRLLLLSLCCLLLPLRCLATEFSSLRGWEAWPRAQELTVEASGLARVVLPPDTLDQLATDYSDLRLVADDSSEIPWTVILPTTPSSSAFPVSSLTVSAEEGSTVLHFSGPPAPALITSLQLFTSASDFNKPLRLEGSDDGSVWVPLLDKLPVFRPAPGRPVPPVRFPPARFARYRLTLGDRSSPPIAITGLSLGIQSVDTSPAAPGALVLVRREEAAGQTRLTLRFSGRGTFLSTLSFVVKDPIFNRPLRLMERRYIDDRIEERVFSQGQISRVPEDSLEPSPRQPSVLRVEHCLPARELILIIDNGDSPPLSLGEFQASYRPLQLLFPAPASGHCLLLAGAPQVSRPSYDLSTLDTRLRSRLAPAPLSPAHFSPFSPNPCYRQSDSLPDFPLLGATLDLKSWKSSRAILLSSPGVQQLDLDPDLLASSAPNYADLRIVNGNSQVPFLIERCSFARLLPLPLTPLASDRPSFSRWSLTLPVPRLPLEGLVLSSSSSLFARRFEVYEQRRDSRGELLRVSLGQGTWQRRTANDSSNFVLRIYQTPASDTLYLETSDGDNLPIVLTHAEARIPVVRLHFKTADLSPLNLLSGNSFVSAPAYDLRLVAAQLLTAPHSEASLSSPAIIAMPEDGLLIRLSRQSSAFFWVALILVAATLLFIIARLLPKKPL